MPARRYRPPGKLRCRGRKRRDESRNDLLETGILSGQMAVLNRKVLLDLSHCMKGCIGVLPRVFRSLVRRRAEEVLAHHDDGEHDELDMCRSEKLSRSTNRRRGGPPHRSSRMLYSAPRPIAGVMSV